MRQGRLPPGESAHTHLSLSSPGEAGVELCAVVLKQNHKEHLIIFGDD